MTLFLFHDQTLLFAFVICFIVFPLTCRYLRRALHHLLISLWTAKRNGHSYCSFKLGCYFLPLSFCLFLSVFVESLIVLTHCTYPIYILLQIHWVIWWSKFQKKERHGLGGSNWESGHCHLLGFERKIVDSVVSWFSLNKKNESNWNMLQTFYL